MDQKLIRWIIFVLALIIQSCHASVLNCNFSTGSCVVVNITDVTSPTEQISVAGMPTDFIDISTYSLTFISPSNLYYVPTALFSIFPNIQSFSMHNVSLNNLVSDAFSNAGNMVSLTITANNFPDLPATFCSSCINITSLTLESNNIVNLDSDALKGLKFLNYIVIRNNKITSIPPGFFQNTVVIQSIDLYGNQLTSLDRLIFKGLPNLYSIMLGSNKIAAIPNFDLTLTGMTMGFNMMLEDNPIMAIHPQFLTNLFSIRSGYHMMTQISWFSSNENITTCIPKNNMYASSISLHTWPVANIYLEDCYKNWITKEESITTTTESILISTEINESGEDFHRWEHKKNFFAILSNAMRNFTANVQFF